MANPNFDQYLTTTLNNHRSELIDGIFDASPLTYFLKEQGRVSIDGGQKWIIPINFEKNTTVGSYTGADVLDISSSPGPTAAEYEWGQYAGAVYIEGIEAARNSGEAAIMKLLDFRIKQLKESTIDAWNTMFWADGSGNGGKDWNGLGNLVLQNAAAVGNIDPTAETQWQTVLTDAGAAALDFPLVRTLVNDCTYGADRPDIAITDQDQYEKFEDLFTDRIRYTDDDTANAGFENIMLKGMKVTWDRSAPAQTFTVLNSKYLELAFLAGMMMKPEDFYSPGDRDIRTANVLSYGQLGVSSRRHHGALQNLAA